MANALFTSYRRDCLVRDIGADYDTDNIKAVLVDHGTDTPVPATDDYLDDIAVGARVATSGNFANKTGVGGTADADDVTWTSVSGASCESIDIYKDTGSAATSPLMVFIDTATGLPVTPGGGDIIAVWDSGANKIFTV